jgi:hypothetical protein
MRKASRAQWERRYLLDEAGSVGGAGRGWITKAPRVAASGGGAADQENAAEWIRGRAPLKRA